MKSCGLSGLFLSYLACYAVAQSTVTSVVSVYSTTTVLGPPSPQAPPGHSDPDDWNHACDNFVGACVVYGSGGEGAAPYTTTVYLTGSSSSSPSAVVTFSTTTIPATTTITAESTGACGDFTGACVVYGTGSGATATTVTSTANGGNNDGDGVIGQSSGGDGQLGGTKNGNGQLGSASSLEMWTTASAVGLLALVFAFLMGL